MITPSAQKPTLLSDTATSTPRHNILADLERRKTRSVDQYGKRKSDKVISLRVVTLGAAILFFVGGVATYVHRAPFSSAVVAKPNSSVATQSAVLQSPLQSMVTTPDAPPAATEPPINTATIVNASATELAADASPLKQPSKTEPASIAVAASKPDQSATKQRHAPATTGAASNNIVVAARTQDATPIIKQPKLQTSVVNRTTDSKSTIGIVAPSSGVDSDVDLLAALIARARQRDPAITTGVSNSGQPATLPCPLKSADIHCSH